MAKWIQHIFLAFIYEGFFRFCLFNNLRNSRSEIGKETTKMIKRGIKFRMSSDPTTQYYPYLTSCGRGVLMVFVDAEGNQFLQEQAGDLVRLVPFILPTAEDCARTSGKLREGKRFVDLENALKWETRKE